MSAALKHPVGRFVLLLLAALVWRCDTFGDPSLHGDEAFYWTVGQAMHHGALPYVDLWDRKPFGLFAIYWLIAGISPSALAYQLTATLAAAGTAWAICAMALRWTSVQGGMLAGLVYILWLGPLQGFGGQSPVFYNLFIALAALLVMRGLPVLREGRAPPGVLLAMLLAGIGITIKTTAFFEAAFLGLYAAFTLLRSGNGVARGLPTVAVWALIGAAPSLAIAGAYWAFGHWEPYWHAMVTSNLTKLSDLGTNLIRLRLMFVAVAPPIVIALFGLLDMGRDERRFVLLWIGAAVISLVAVGNFYIHYAMPLTVPLCLAGAAFLSRGAIGWVATLATAALSYAIAPPFQFEHTRQSREAMAALVETVRAHDAGRDLLTFEGPSQLYPLAHKRFVSPLVFPTHLSALIEKDVSHLSTAGEMRRALAAYPGVVVIARPIHNGPVNLETQAMVQRYVYEHCRLVGMRRIFERTQSIDLAVWGECRAGPDRR
jgi:hypothetical protein